MSDLRAAEEGASSHGTSMCTAPSLRPGWTPEPSADTRLLLSQSPSPPPSPPSPRPPPPDRSPPEQHRGVGDAVKSRLHILLRRQASSASTSSTVSSFYCAGGQAQSVVDISPPLPWSPSPLSPFVPPPKPRLELGLSRPVAARDVPAASPQLYPRPKYLSIVEELDENGSSCNGCSMEYVPIILHSECSSAVIRSSVDEAVPAAPAAPAAGKVGSCPASPTSLASPASSVAVPCAAVHAPFSRRDAVVFYSRYDHP